MSRKKINFNAKTKLDSIPEENNQEFQIIKTPKSTRPVSFRLRDIDLQRINHILQNANDLNESQNFNKTSLIRGLIMLGMETESKDILDMIRQSI